MSKLNVSINSKKKVLVIEIPMQKPTPSASGKTLVVATTRGNQLTDCKIDGKQITVGVNAYFKP